MTSSEPRDWQDLRDAAGEARTARLFRNGSNQALRLPRGLEFDGVDEVLIYRVGDRLVIEAKRPNWLDLASLPPVGDDFLAEDPKIGIDTEQTGL